MNSPESLGLLPASRALPRSRTFPARSGLLSIVSVVSRSASFALAVGARLAQQAAPPACPPLSGDVPLVRRGGLHGDLEGESPVASLRRREQVQTRDYQGVVQLVGRDGKIIGKLNRKFLFYDQVPGVELLVDEKNRESMAAAVAFPWLLKLSEFVFQLARRTDNDPAVKEARDLIGKMTQPMMPAGEKIAWESPEAP